ncbi:hypothetical protein [Hoeflea sp.]|uniref:hypothetical protein n=1 Tax=Hoeflea sp. TaxID=1940281 RepID=UPI003B01CE54
MMTIGEPAVRNLQRTYSATYSPGVMPYESSGHRAFAISVADDFVVDCFTVSIRLFSPVVWLLDMTLVGPDGETAVRLTHDNCGHSPIAFGTRLYENGGYGFDPDIGPRAIGGKPAFYKFADNGIALGRTRLETATVQGEEHVEVIAEPGTACEHYWRRARRGGEFLTRPQDGSFWGIKGAFLVLQPNIVYAPTDGALSDFRGLSAKGVWRLDVRKWKTAPGPTPAWLRADTRINTLALEFEARTILSPPIR